MIPNTTLVPAHLLFEPAESLGEGSIAIRGATLGFGGKARGQVDPRITAEMIRIAREGRRHGYRTVEILACTGGEMLADMFGQRRADLDLLALDLDMHWTSRTCCGFMRIGVLQWAGADIPCRVPCQIRVRFLRARPVEKSRNGRDPDRAGAPGCGHGRADAETPSLPLQDASSHGNRQAFNSGFFGSGR